MLNNYQRTILNDVELQISDKLQEYVYEQINEKTITSIKCLVEEKLTEADKVYGLNLRDIEANVCIDSNSVYVSWKRSNHLENFGN